MQATTVRVSRSAHQKLATLARESNQSLQQTLEEAIEALRRKSLLERTNQAYAILRQDPVAWKEYREEMAAFEVTLEDGL